MFKVALLTVLLSSAARAADHPGNVYLSGEEVAVPVPAAWAGWRALDIDGKELAHGAGPDLASLGKLPVGYVELRETPGTGRVTAAVLPHAVNPADPTPIAVDAAVAWFYSDPRQIHDACRLIQLAGVRWVRDRASWPELEPSRGTWAPGETRYEKALHIQKDLGLKVLQVNHISPPWAAADPKHFPDDLRDVFNFYQGLAKRWHGLVDAIEPWNEPDIDMFGGHTGCEIASFQKAAYLGLKSGDPALPVCQSVFAIDRAETLDEFGTNNVSAYFDIYNLHHYVALTQYARAYGRHRAVSGGRPMWTSEFNLPIKYSDEQTHELSDENLRVHAYRVVKVYSQAIHEGCENAFYFIFGDYVERGLQYGLVHADLTPRPAYCAFAAVGRFLNGAKPLGRVDLGDDKLKSFAFRTKVDGADTETLVAWAETKSTPANFPKTATLYDCYGRELPKDANPNLTRSPLFAIVAPGTAAQLKLQPPPAKPNPSTAAPSPLVLQLIGKGVANSSAFQLDSARTLRLVAYNFGPNPITASLLTENATLPTSDLNLAPWARQEFSLRVDSQSATLTVRAQPKSAPQAIVSARVLD